MKQLRLFFWMLALGLLTLGQWACRPDAEKFDPSPSRDIRLSDDSLKFDTVITQLATPSRRFRIYNPNAQAIRLSHVAISPNSPFDLIVNGRQGRSIPNVDIRGGDSIMVVVQGRVGLVPSDLPFLIEDSVGITVQGRSGTSWVYVEAKGQNANFYTDSLLPCATVWDDRQKPYFIKDDVLVPKGCTLTIREGVTVLNYKNSSIIVRGTLLVQGTRQAPVRFLGTRQESQYDNQPDQWYAIGILDSSQGSSIDWAIIKNGTRGLQVGTLFDKQQPFGANYPKASCRISNSIIANMSEAGIMSFRGDVTGFNNLIYDCAQFNVACFLGGRYALIHNTLGYTGLNGFVRRNPSVVFAETYSVPGVFYQPGKLELAFYNNIVSGGQEEELALLAASPSVSTDPPSIFGNIIRTKISSLSANNANTVLTTFFPFADVRTRNFMLPPLSSAKERGLSLTDFTNDPAPLQTDLAGSARPVNRPDAGAYQGPQ